LLHLFSKLYQKYREELFNIYPLSMHYFQTRPHQQKEALRLMESKLALLKEMGHIDEGSLTAKGEFAKAVYGFELLLAELYDGGIFEDLDEISMGVMAVAAVFEPRKNQHLPSLSRSSQYLKSICETFSERIRHKEVRHVIHPFSKIPHFNLAKALEGWMHGMKFAKILEITDTDEGEVIRYFRMAIQILREIEHAPISPVLDQRIKQAIRLINRDVIDAEKQLRES